MPSEPAPRRNPYAERARRRLVADLLYLALWPELGHEEAARRACAEHGHEPVKGACARCGAPAHLMRDHHLAKRGRATL